MTKKMEVDLKKSLGYQANGRVKRENIERASLAIKKFVCPNCHEEEDAEKNVFGEVKKCPACGQIMLNQY